jgi:methyl-accepting chemotaxis protein
MTASIGKRFLAGGILFTIALVFAIAVTSIRTDNLILRNQMDLRGKSMVGYMAKTSLFYYRNYDLGALEGFVKEITRDPEVAFAVFYDDKKKPMTTSSVAPADSSALLVFDNDIKDESGATLGTVALGYRTRLLDEGVRRMVEIMVASAIVAIIVAALGIVVIVRRLIVAPLDAAVGVANRLAEGDLTVRFESRGGDEIGALLAALERMRGSFAGAVGTIRQSARSVGTASRQIAAGNTELSSRTEEQASSLEETASSMQELTATVKQNAENAEQANAVAIDASKVAGRGGQSMIDVVATMQGIAQASRKIADIISVIDGIAFQTNILALNAAVEAARAGEQGRGFAVVASEVRSLAQRSADAASEIKKLINDSVGRVDAGTKLVEGAGATIEDIVTSVQRMTELMSEIAAASRQQLAGIEQVGNAVTQMDRGTQQNAAIVEQTAASAENMAALATQLNEAVARFKLEEGGDAAAAAPQAARLEATRANALIAHRSPAPRRIAPAIE